MVPATGDSGVLNCGFSQVDINFDGQDGSAVLSCYEMGVLVRQHDVSGLDKDIFAEFYPDLDYWFLP